MQSSWEFRKQAISDLKILYLVQIQNNRLSFPSLTNQPKMRNHITWLTCIYIYIIDYKYKTNQVNIGESGDITSISSSNHSKFKPPNLSTFNALAWYLAWDLRRLEQLGSNEDLKDFWDSTSKVSPGPNSTKGTNHHPVHAKQNHQKPTNISWKKQWFWWWELRSFQRKTSQELGNLSRGRRVDLDLFRWETQRKGMLFVFGEWLWVKRHEKKKTHILHLSFHHKSFWWF